MDHLIYDRLPHVTSGVDRYLLNIRGEVEGMMLTNGLEIRFPTWFSAALQAAVRPGQRVTVYGTRSRGATFITAALVQTEEGVEIADRGPPPAAAQPSMFHTLKAGLSGYLAALR
jgi:hypothetical protein